MNVSKQLFFVVLMVGAAVAAATCPVPPANISNEAAKKLAIGKLSQLLVCSENDPLNDQSPCNIFAAKGMESIYGISDFHTGPSTFMTANEIASEIEKDSRWKLIGSVLDDQNSLCAQSVSNTAYPVVAIMKGELHGHIALVIPGEPKSAPSWGNKLAPNSASFFLGKPSQAYVNGPLSKAFGLNDAAKAKYYYRTEDK